jgi:hypothetical protein
MIFFQANRENYIMLNRKCIATLGYFVSLLFLITGCFRLPPPPIPTDDVTPSTSPTPTETEPAPVDNTDTPGISSPPPGEDEVWFDSYPGGAKVYVVPATVDIYDLELDDVTQVNNLLGTAPFTHDLSSGNYYVVPVFTQDLFSTAGYELPTLSDPTYDFAFPFDGNLSQQMSFIAGEEIERIYKIYRLNKSGRNSEALISIALPLPETQRGQQKPALYPTLATVSILPTSYTFEDTFVRQAIDDNLKEYNLTAIVGPDMVDEMIEVLMRVGKVKLDTSDVDLIIQMKGTDSAQFSITAYS